MNKGTFFHYWMIIAVAVIGTACTVAKQSAPPLSGPSELGLSFAISANPDALSQDGASQSQITIQAFDSNGQPAKNVAFRAEITVNGTVTDFGSLSARTLVTDSNGRATLIYTAPAAPLVSIDTGASVAIRFTPSAGDRANALARQVSIRLVPPGVIIGTTGPAASFTVNPAAPQANVPATFTSTSIAGTGGSVVSTSWDFGDGAKATGSPAIHSFNGAGNYSVTLTAMDNNGFTGSTTQLVSVGAGTKPVATFTISPTSGNLTGQTIFFNASGSTASAGHRIVRYDWDFGTGSTASGITVGKSYDTAGSYLVTLTVTDEVGQSGLATNTVTVASASGNPSPLAAVFTFSPTAPSVSQTVFFNASASTTPSGTTITAYAWDFGDGSTATGVTPTHAFTTAAIYVVRLTVTNSAGSTATTTNSVPVTASAGSAMTAVFTFSPAAPSASQTVFFNASASTTPSGTTITSYAWDFGDGSTATGVTPTHAFTTAATFVVRLTVTNSAGATATTTTSIPITAGSSALTADFTFSPTNPVSGTLVNFNANLSSPIGAINQYDWDFGDGTSVVVSGVNNFTVNHAFTTSVTFTYTVRLTVHDTSGRTATVTKSVPVIGGSAPTAAFTISPSPAPVNSVVTFDGLPSTAQAPATVTRYTWDFGDGSAVVSTTAPTTSTTHTYTVKNTYTITLTVTDSSGRTSSTSHTLLVN